MWDASNLEEDSSSRKWLIYQEIWWAKKLPLHFVTLRCLGLLWWMLAKKWNNIGLSTPVFLACRAIQIEVTYSLNTDSFIMCLRRFIGQRRNVRLIGSNKEWNFIGASAELIQAFQEMDHSRISNYLEEHCGEWIKWKRNPPFASIIEGG